MRKITKETIKKIFDFQDWIIGSESGGIEGPRILLGIEENENGFTVKYTWPEVCGLSDCPYHDTRAGKIYTDVYTYDGDRLLRNGSSDILEMDRILWEKKEAEEFLKELGLAA